MQTKYGFKVIQKGYTKQILNKDFMVTQNAKKYISGLR